MYARSGIENASILSKFCGNKWKVVERDEYQHGDEADSHDATFHKVPIRTRSSLPRLLATERTDIIGQCPVPPAGLYEVCERGHPFAWHEKKPIDWYKTFLKEIAAGLVADLTPGSGALARACLDEGIQYIGVCCSQQHLQLVVKHP